MLTWVYLCVIMGYVCDNIGHIIVLTWVMSLCLLCLYVNIGYIFVLPFVMSLCKHWLISMIKKLDICLSIG